jgi:hypothetical protein
MKHPAPGSSPGSWQSPRYQWYQPACSRSDTGQAGITCTVSDQQHRQASLTSLFFVEAPWYGRCCTTMFLMDWFYSVIGSLGRVYFSDCHHLTLLPRRALCISQISENSLPRARQCRKDDTLSHAQGRSMRISTSVRQHYSSCTAARALQLMRISATFMAPPLPRSPISC